MKTWERFSYRKYALVVFVIFGGLHALRRGPLLWPWLADPIGWRGMLLAFVEVGTLGVVIVTFLRWAKYKFWPRAPQP
jgi:hypothetical protein